MTFDANWAAREEAMRMTKADVMTMVGAAPEGRS